MSTIHVWERLRERYGHSLLIAPAMQRARAVECFRARIKARVAQAPSEAGSVIATRKCSISTKHPARRLGGLLAQRVSSPTQRPAIRTEQSTSSATARALLSGLDRTVTSAVSFAQF